MISKSTELQKLWTTDGVRKTLWIYFPNGEHSTITNDTIISESFSMTESISSRTSFEYGLCEPSSVSFRFHEQDDATNLNLIDKYIFPVLFATGPSATNQAFYHMNMQSLPIMLEALVTDTDTSKEVTYTHQARGTVSVGLSIMGNITYTGSSTTSILATIEVKIGKNGVYTRDVTYNILSGDLDPYGYYYREIYNIGGGTAQLTDTYDTAIISIELKDNTYSGGHISAQLRPIYDGQLERYPLGHYKITECDINPFTNIVTISAQQDNFSSEEKAVDKFRKSLKYPYPVRRTIEPITYAYTHAPNIFASTAIDGKHRFRRWLLSTSAISWYSGSNTVNYGYSSSKGITYNLKLTLYSYTYSPVLNQPHLSYYCSIDRHGWELLNQYFYDTINFLEGVLGVIYDRSVVLKDEDENLYRTVELAHSLWLRAYSYTDHDDVCSNLFGLREGYVITPIFGPNTEYYEDHSYASDGYISNMNIINAFYLGTTWFGMGSSSQMYNYDQYMFGFPTQIAIEVTSSDGSYSANWTSQSTPSPYREDWRNSFRQVYYTVNDKVDISSVLQWGNTSYGTICAANSTISYTYVTDPDTVLSVFYADDPSSKTIKNDSVETTAYLCEETDSTLNIFQSALEIFGLIVKYDREGNIRPFVLNEGVTKSTPKYRYPADNLYPGNTYPRNYTANILFDISHFIISGNYDQKDNILYNGVRIKYSQEEYYMIAGSEYYKTLVIDEVDKFYRVKDSSGSYITDGEEYVLDNVVTKHAFNYPNIYNGQRYNYLLRDLNLIRNGYRKTDSMGYDYGLNYQLRYLSLSNISITSLGFPFIEPGDVLEIKFSNGIAKQFTVLKRTLSGIQHLEDSMED